VSLYDAVQMTYGDAGEFVANLRSRMKLHGISAGKLGVRAGFKASNMSFWLNGKRKPGLKTMLILDEAINQLIEGK
jgi:transcriptional regulator with XRE-family HTH domain